MHHTRGCSYTWSKPGRVDGVLLYCFDFWLPRNPKAGGRSNLDAHFEPARMRAPTRGAHAVEFSKTAAPLLGGDSSV